MKGSSRDRTAALEMRQEWTARLVRFAQASTVERKQAELERAQQINPGGTLRDMLEAWGYSSSGRGRKAKEAEHHDKPARERLEDSLKELFGRASSPVKSLYPKLAGKTFVTVRDAARIVAALIAAWPEPLKGEPKNVDERRRRAKQLAEDFMRVLLTELTEGRSWEWTPAEMEGFGFLLADEERIRGSQFIKDAGEREGALIVASTKNILVGPDPVSILRLFREAASNFVQQGSKGLLIFVFNAGLFDAGDDRFDLLFNLGQLTTAMTAFALFEDDLLQERPTIRLYKVDWSRWQSLSARCCVVVRRPPLVAPDSGELLARENFDDFIRTWLPRRPFDRLENVEAIRSFGGRDILPRAYPAAWDANGAMEGRDFHWDVVIQPSAKEPEGLLVEYFIPHTFPGSSAPANGAVIEAGSGSHEQSGRGRPSAQIRPVEGEITYLIRKGSPGRAYDDAQRAIYRAARGRLHLDTGTKHEENLLAAAGLREVGYEVLPISVALSLIPRSLYYAAAPEPQDIKKNKAE